MKDNLSPEEKLLRLIRGPKKKSEEPKAATPSAAASAAPIPTPAKHPKFKLPLPQKPLAFTLDFKKINTQKLIVCIFIISCIYLLVSFIYPLVALKNIKLPQADLKKAEDLKNSAQPEMESFDYYQQGLKNRQVFVSGTTSEAGGSLMGLPSASAAELIKDINLVGVISGDNPQAIIEDKKSQKTFYVTKGQFIGQFQIETIEDGRITLNYNDQRFELRL